MARFTCAHIKKDNTICGNKCCDPTGCYRHWKLYEKNQKKKPCLFSGCGYHTDNDSGYCSSHSAKIYSHNHRMRQKRKSEGLQPEIPEAPISESYDRSALIHEYLFPASSQLFADSIQVEVLLSSDSEIEASGILGWRASAPYFFLIRWFSEWNLPKWSGQHPVVETVYLRQSLTRQDFFLYFFHTISSAYNTR